MLPQATIHLLCVTSALEHNIIERESDLWGLENGLSAKRYDLNEFFTCYKYDCVGVLCIVFECFRNYCGTYIYQHFMMFPLFLLIAGFENLCIKYEKD